MVGGAIQPQVRRQVAAVVFADVFLAEIVAVIRRRLAEVERAEAERVERLRTGEVAQWKLLRPQGRSEEHTSELQSLVRSSNAVFCLKTKTQTTSAGVSTIETTRNNNTRRTA